jgi:uncharacterized protein YndB with AHSA1/START domain
MSQNIVLAVDVEADPARIFEILSTTEGQRGFWTANCDVTTGRARFGFVQSPVDLITDVAAEPGKLVRMTVTSGFPFWTGSTFEWELSAPVRAASGTGVLFRHYGFGDGYPEAEMAHTAQTWAMIMDRLAGYAGSGAAQPFFPETA